jgi:transcriptional regulator with XRE-family HTH domain
MEASPIAGVPLSCDNVDMRMPIVVAWIQDQLKERGVAQEALAEHIGIHPSELSKLLKGKRKGLTIEQFAKAVEFFGGNIPDGLFDSPRIYVKKAPLRGGLSAGVLRAKTMISKGALAEVPYLPTAEFAQLEQYAYQLEDNHAEDYAPAFAYVIFVDFHKARPKPLNGDIVRVEQRFAVSGGKASMEVTESTLRRIEIAGDRVILRKLSSTIPYVHDITIDSNSQNPKICDLAIGFFVVTATQT